MKKALIVYGGWDGHEPEPISRLFQEMLEQEGYEVERSDTLDAYLDNAKLRSLDLIVPHWTMGDLTLEQMESVLDAIASGVGVAGVHAGLADAFHDRPDWQNMAGSQFISHPGGQHLRYTVNITSNSSVITEGIEDFTVESELYYIQVDPAIDVLATINYPVGEGPFEATDYMKLGEGQIFGEWFFDGKDKKDEFNTKNPHLGNKPVLMPAVYTKMWGRGRVFYCSVGHDEKLLRTEPLNTLVKRGMLWASK